MTETKFDMLKELWEEKNLTALKRFLYEENPVDIAEMLSEFEEAEPKSLPTLYRLLSKEAAAEVFVEFDGDTAERLIGALSDKELAETLSEMFYDDAADLIEEMPANVVKRILKNTSPADRKEINKLLKFPDGSAGSIMTTEFVSLQKEMTVGQALDHIRKVALDKETVYTCYVTDETRYLEGFVTALVLLTSPTEKTVGELMESNIISAATSDDREEVARTLTKYDFLALPVVDSENRLVGIVTVDDAIDVIQEETEEDFSVMAAITPTEVPYLKTPVRTIFKSRIPWLLLLMFTATFTGMIISSFEDALSAKVVLSVFIPMLMGTGGNCGSQSSITVIRSLSLGEIKLSDTLKILLKEFRVAFACSVCLAVFEFIKMMTLDRVLLSADIDVLVALTVSLTLIATVFFAKTVGAALPLLASKLKLDPAVMASPFITTLVDTASLFIYFSVAKVVLGI
ncbi:MAG: magnesium transporter [Clostridia bacterium]|nr:magnesium transporter [Clostridia bacterium]